MPDHPSSNKPPVHHAARPAQMPVIEGLTPEKWQAAMKRRPANIPGQEWGVFMTTLFEISAGRLVPAARLKAAKITAGKANMTEASIKKLDDAETQALMSEATATGRQEIAAQAPLKFVRHGAPAHHEAEAPHLAAHAPAHALAHAPHVATHAPAHAPQHPSAHVAHAADVKLPAGLAPDQTAGYRHVVAAVKSGNTQGISYGKLNFAHEISRRAGDPETGLAIATVMHRMRPLAPGAGRYGVSDAEYTNYARVENVIKGGVDKSPISGKDMVLAHRTALKYGHSEQADMIASFLPTGAVAAHAHEKVATAAPAKKPVIIKVPGEIPVEGKIPARVVSLGPPPAGITAEEWKRAPHPPAGIAIHDWRTYLTVNFLLNNHGKVSSVADLHRAAGVSMRVSKDPGEGMILYALAKGEAATVNNLVEARRLALEAHHPKTAHVLGERVIVAAHKSTKPEDLKKAQAVAEEMGHHKTAAALAKRIAPAAGAAAAATAVAVATHPRVHHGAPPPPAARPHRAPSWLDRESALSAPVRRYTAADSKTVDDGMRKLDRYEKEALQNAADKVARHKPLTLKELTEAQAAADKAGLAVPAARFGKMASDLHEKIALEQEGRLAGTRARISARPTLSLPPPPPPVVVAKVPVMPPPVIIADQASKLGVPTHVADDLLKTAKGSGPLAKDARKTIEEGAKIAQQADAGNPAAQKQISDLQVAATQPGPEAAEAQKKLAGIAAANSVTVTVNSPAGAAGPAGAPGAPGAPAPYAGPAPSPAPSYGAPEPRGEALPPPLVSSAPAPQGRSMPVADRGPAPEAPPPPAPPTPGEVASPGDTPVSGKLVKGAAVALGVGAVAAGAAKVILGSKKGDEGDKNNMLAGAQLVDDLESQDPARKAAAQNTLAEIKARDKGGDPMARKQLEGVAAAAATKKAIEEKKRKDQAEVLKEVRGSMIQASVAGPDTGNYTPAILGGLLFAGAGVFMALKGRKKVA